MQSLMESIRQRDPNEHEFLQAVDEVLHTVTPVLSRHPEYFETMKRLAEPERTIMFRVPWCAPLPTTCKC